MAAKKISFEGQVYNRTELLKVAAAVHDKLIVCDSFIDWCQGYGIPHPFQNGDEVVCSDFYLNKRSLQAQVSYEDINCFPIGIGVVNRMRQEYIIVHGEHVP